jgi:hypothetical protein
MLPPKNRGGSRLAGGSGGAETTDEELNELVALIREIALAWEPEARLLGNMTAGQLARAADLLERLTSDNAGLAAAADSLYADNMSLLDNHHD